MERFKVLRLDQGLMIHPTVMTSPDYQGHGVHRIKFFPILERMKYIIR